MSTPEFIYLIPGEYEGYPEMVWCDDPAPSYADDPADAVKYLRFDVHNSIIGMDAANKDAIWREENAKRMLSQSNPTALESERAANADLTEEIEHLQDALISQGKMLSAIVNITKGPPEEGSLHSTHDSVESVERLQARLVELECREDAMCDLHYANGAKQGFSWGQASEEKALHQCVSARMSAGVSELAELRNDADKAEGDSE